MHNWFYSKEARGDWYSLTVLGWKFHRYASGKRVTEPAQWFHVLCILAAVAIAYTVLILAVDWDRRTKCSDYGIMTSKPIKYSTRSGCYVLRGDEYIRVRL